jgi:hypothetical protein
MPNVTVIDHPLVIAKLTRLRCKDTDSLDFRRLLGEISLLMSARKPVVVIDEWDGDRCGGGGFRYAKTKLKQQ